MMNAHDRCPLRVAWWAECQFNQAFGTLTVKLPESLPAKYTNVLSMELG